MVPPRINPGRPSLRYSFASWRGYSHFWTKPQWRQPCHVIFPQKGKRGGIPSGPSFSLFIQKPACARQVNSCVKYLLGRQKHLCNINTRWRQAVKNFSKIQLIYFNYFKLKFIFFSEIIRVCVMYCFVVVYVQVGDFCRLKHQPRSGLHASISLEFARLPVLKSA